VLVSFRYIQHESSHKERLEDHGHNRQEGGWGRRHGDRVVAGVGIAVADETMAAHGHVSPEWCALPRRPCKCGSVNYRGHVECK